MWRAQVGRAARRVPRRSRSTCPGTARWPTSRSPSAARGRAGRRDDRAEAAGGRAVVVGLSLGGYVAMDLAARRPELVRGLVLSGATAEPVGVRALPYLALAWAMDRFDGPRGSTRLNAWFFRTPLPAGDRRADRRRRVLVDGGAAGAAGARRRAVRAAPGRLPGPDAHPQRRVRPPLPAVARGRSPRPRPTPDGSVLRGRDPPRQPRPAGRLHDGGPPVRPRCRADGPPGDG